MKKLKLCPFCGGEARLMDMGYPHWIYCKNCGARVHGGVIGEKGEKASIEAWNRRADPVGWIRGRDPNPKRTTEYLTKDSAGIISARLWRPGKGWGTLQKPPHDDVAAWAEVPKDG